MGVILRKTRPKETNRRIRMCRMAENVARPARPGDPPKLHVGAGADCPAADGEVASCCCPAGSYDDDSDPTTACLLCSDGTM